MEARPSGAAPEHRRPRKTLEKITDRIRISSARKIHVVVSGALLDAVRDGIIPVNFADYVEFPREQKFEGKAYTPEQVAALLDAAEQEGEPIRAAVTLAVIYGLRRSEICGLRWKDIDFEKGTLDVRNTMTQNGTLVIEAERTKTRKSRRTIDLIGSTVPYLRELRQTQEQNGLVLDKVCAWPNGRPVRPDYLTRGSARSWRSTGWSTSGCTTCGTRRPRCWRRGPRRSRYRAF